MNSEEVIYKKYLDELRENIALRYNETGRKASGKFENEMETVISETGGVIMGAPHSYYVEKGRHAGKFPPISAIEDWIDVKQGLPAIFREKKKQYAFLIARKIANEGTQGSDVLESILQNFLGETIWNMLRELGDSYAFRIQNDIVRLIKSFTKAA